MNDLGCHEAHRADARLSLSFLGVHNARDLRTKRECVCKMSVSATHAEVAELHDGETLEVSVHKHVLALWKS